MHTPKHHFTSNVFAVKLLRSELIYDMDFTANRISKTIMQSAGAQAGTNIILSGEENADWVDDTITDAVNNVAQRLRFCLISYSRLSDDQVRIETGSDSGVEFTMSLNLPHWTGSSSTLARYIHEYVVNYVLSEWFLMTAKDYAPVYAEKARKNLTRIVNEARSTNVKTPVYRL